jgi:hypothetical protein
MWGIELHMVKGIILVELLMERKEEVEWKKKDSGRTEWSASTFQDPAGTRGMQAGCHAIQSRAFTKSLSLVQNSLLRGNRKRSPIKDTVEQGV